MMARNGARKAIFTFAIASIVAITLAGCAGSIDENPSEPDTVVASEAAIASDEQFDAPGALVLMPGEKIPL